MITWEQFFEGREKESLENKEERLHKDLDGDGEKGESAAHKKKVLGKKGCAKMSPKKAPKKSKKM